MLVLAIAPLALCAQTQSAPAPANPLPDVAAKLAAIGVAVDAKKVEFDPTASMETNAPTLADYNVRLYGPGWFDTLWLGLRACGRPVSEDPATFRTQTALEMLGPQVAWYVDESKRIFANPAVLPRTPDIEAVLAHELTHAAQDQREGIHAIFGRLGKAFDGFLIARCLTEGEADAASRAVVLAREKKTLKDLDRADFALRHDEIAQGGILYHYGLGREVVVDRFRAGGWKAVHDLFAKPPPSTEQLAHPSKLGKDAPVVVALPDLLADGAAPTLVRDDTWGELGLNMFLVIAGAKSADAHLASVGWDGDRVRVWKLADGAWALAWRTAWDRDEDAKQFEAALASVKAEGSIARKGRVVDWVFADRPEIAKTLVAALEKTLPPPGAPESDGASTAAIEAAWNAMEPRIEKGRWIVPDFGISIAAPDRWETAIYQGMTALREPEDEVIVATGFRSNFIMLRNPIPSGTTVDAVLEQTRAVLGRAPFKIVSAERGTVGGRDALILDYTSRQMGRRLHHFEVQFIGAREKVSVTASVFEARWPEIGEALSKSLRELSFVAPVTPR